MSERTVVEGRVCHCGGSIIKTVTEKKAPWYGPPVYGPGWKDRFQEAVGYHCEDCGLVYRLTKEGTVGLKKNYRKEV